MILVELSSIKDRQDDLDRILTVDDTPCSADKSTAPIYPTYVLDVQDRQNCIKITESTLDIANFASTLLTDYSGYNRRVVFSLDTECDTRQNPNGQVIWSGSCRLNTTTE
jgi:hypothetical protein